MTGNDDLQLTLEEHGEAMTEVCFLLDAFASHDPRFDGRRHGAGGPDRRKAYGQETARISSRAHPWRPC